MIMLITSIVITGILLFASLRVYANFKALEKATDDYIELEKKALDLMEASDYLTEQVQCYTVLGDRKYLDNYMTEAFETKRRENAIETIGSVMPNSPALAELKNSMNNSVKLMDTEYYAMVLVLDATGDTDIPEALKDVSLTAEDAALSSKAKMALAMELVHDETYQMQKDKIREDFNASIDALKEKALTTQQTTEGVAQRALISVIILVIIQSILIVSMIWIHTRLGIKPVLQAVDHIKKDENIPIIGASEFRYLAGAYNVMYNTYRNSIAHLNYKASHDPLTGVYNRAGYDIIKNSLDMTTTAMIIIDVDKFKQINDTRGHETGDKALKRIADTLTKSFRSDDYICRIGGDEFLILMVHITDDPQELIENKIDRINSELSELRSDVPQITVSAGVCYSKAVIAPDIMFHRADIALYDVKENGRGGCSFYNDKLEVLAAHKVTSVSEVDEI